MKSGIRTWNMPVPGNHGLTRNGLDNLHAEYEHVCDPVAS